MQTVLSVARNYKSNFLDRSASPPKIAELADFNSNVKDSERCTWHSKNRNLQGCNWPLPVPPYLFAARRTAAQTIARVFLK
jgi:hypothetical protein